MWIILLFGMLLSCQETASGKMEQSPLSEHRTATANTREVPVDVQKSLIHWKGTKMMKTGKHEGTIKFSEGTLLFKGEQLTGGSFIVDMHTIEITDIPKHETVPRRNLSNHLHSDFETDRYPNASFEMTAVAYSSGQTLSIEGNLTIKGITRPVRLEAQAFPQQGRFEGELIINRFDWGIGADGSWLEQKLVDEDIYLQIELFQ